MTILIFRQQNLYWNTNCDVFLWSFQGKLIFIFIFKQIFWRVSNYNNLSSVKICDQTNWSIFPTSLSAMGNLSLLISADHCVIITQTWHSKLRTPFHHISRLFKIFEIIQMALRAIKLKRKIKFPSPLLNNQPLKRNSMIPFQQKFNLFVTQCTRQEYYLQAKF